MIEVLPTRPSISFSSDKPVYILDNGVASLPISLSGRGPFDIGVMYADGKERKLRLPGSARFIDFPGVGIHKLVSISDSICEGQVEGVSQVQVFSIDRPTMDVPRQANTVLPDACVGAESSFQVKVHGKAPFIIGFSQTLIPILLDGTSLPKESAIFTETVDTSFLQLAVNTSKAGLHTYSFNSLADDNYKTPVTLPKPIVFSQKIHPIPKAYFIEPEHRVFHCASAAKGPYRLKVVLQGQPPFAVKIEQKRDNQHIGYIFKENIGSDDELELEKENGGYVWNPQTINMDGMGKHEFIMISVSDSNGCILNFDSSEPVSTFFEIADQARIHTFNPSDVCIGDLLSYTLQGTPPFTIGYKWQGVPQADIIVADPMLSIWVGSSGTVEITKICNSADCCDENVSSDVSLTTRVHALPRAVVGSGDDSFDDIKEGDESSFSVDFEGTPPFSFTYARSRGSGSKSAVKEELFTVSDITEKHVSKHYLDNTDAFN
jgi:nucleoporin POM152